MNYDFDKASHNVMNRVREHQTEDGWLADDARFVIRAALGSAYAAGLEAGKAEQAGKVAAWEPVVRAACEYVIAHDARTVVLSKTLDTWRETRRLDLAITALLDSGRALAPEHRPAAGGGA